MQPTEEQAAVIASPTAGLVKIVAYAGTGKTWVLVQYAKARPYLRGLYIAYNKSTQMDASRRFPTSVLCKTIHGLAYAKFGGRYKHKLVTDLRASDVINAMELSHDWDFAKLVIDTVKAYMASAATAFPVKACALDKELNVPPIRSQYAAMIASKLWDAMCNPESKVPMVHDGYLKLYQLSKPVLPFDFILLDEYQDTNEVTSSIVLNQTCARLLVGDPYQQIYKFRGATDALESVKADQTFYLTQSWRFGPNVAKLASRLLSEFFGETRPVIGRGKDTSIGVNDLGQPFVTLCRTNAEVFYRAVGAVSAGMSIGFVGGVNSYGFELIHDAYKLSTDATHDIRDAFIRSFGSYGDYEQFAIDSDDREAKMVQKVVATFGATIPTLIQQIKDSALPSVKDAQRGLSTVHKSKGMEFENVVLADDFWDLIGPAGPITNAEECNPEEARLTYVALTRAVGNLQLNSQLVSFASWCGLTFENPVSGFQDDDSFDPVFGSAPKAKKPIATKKKVKPFTENLSLF